MSNYELALVLSKETGLKDHLVASIVEDLVRLATRHSWIQTELCNGVGDDDLLAEVEAEDEAVEARITSLVSPYGILPIFSGDPRGATVKLALPSGRTNDFGNTGWVVPIDTEDEDEVLLEGASLDYEAIRRLVDAEDWEEDCEDPDLETRGVFVGTVFGLTPSGKYYTGWACSNVTEAEVEADADWFATVEEELSEYELSLVRSPYDPCDLFISEYRDRE